MSATRDNIRDEMKTLEQKLSLMTLHSWNYRKIGDRRRRLILLQMQLEQIEKMTSLATVAGNL